MEKFAKLFVELFSRYAFAAVLCLLIPACISCSSDDELSEVSAAERTVPMELVGTWFKVDDTKHDSNLQRVKFSRNGLYSAYAEGGEVIVVNLPVKVDSASIAVYYTDSTQSNFMLMKGLYAIITYSFRGDTLFTDEVRGCHGFSHKYLKN